MNESRNIERCRRDLKAFIDRGDIAVPTVMYGQSSSKILTMKFEEGFHVNERNRIKDLGINSSDVARLISTAFYEQM